MLFPLAKTYTTLHFKVSYPILPNLPFTAHPPRSLRSPHHVKHRSRTAPLPHPQSDSKQLSPQPQPHLQPDPSVVPYGAIPDSREGPEAFFYIALFFVDE